MVEMLADEPGTRELWDTVLTLALPADEQLAILQAIGTGCPVDELALDFDAYYRPFANGSGLNPAEATALKELDSALDAMSGPSNAGYWSKEALQNDPVWDGVRRLARRALAKRQITRLQRASA